MARYIVNYGETESSYQYSPVRFTAKRDAMHHAAEMVRALGGQAWAYVAPDSYRHDGAPEPAIATWRNGRRAS